MTAKTSKTTAAAKPAVLRPAPKPSQAAKKPAATSASKPTLTTGQSMFLTKKAAADAKAGKTAATSAPAEPKLKAGAAASKTALAEAKARALANQPKPTAAELEGATVTTVELPAATVAAVNKHADALAKKAATSKPAPAKRATVDGKRQIAPRGCGIRIDTATNRWRIRYGQEEIGPERFDTFELAREAAVAELARRKNAGK